MTTFKIEKEYKEKFGTSIKNKYLDGKVVAAESPVVEALVQDLREPD